jgi:TonB family protein
MQRSEMMRILFFASLFLSISNLMAQNYLSGDIPRNTRWQGEVFIDGDVTIPQGVILTIEAGTRIYFKPKSDVLKSGKDKERAELNVNGMILAKSNSMTSPIIFTSQSKKPQMNDWYGITIKNFYDQSILQNCIVEFAYKGITCYGSAPIISGGEIRFNHNSGISCEVKAAPIISNLMLMGNGFAGINCELASNPIISHCTISDNNYGVIIFSRSAPDLGTVPLDGKTSKGENRISNNFDYDVYNHSNNSIYAQNNAWLSVNPRQIPAVIYDNSDNPAYGEVIYLPVFTESRPVVQPPVVIAAAQPLPSLVTDRTSQSLVSVIPPTSVSEDTAAAITQQTFSESMPPLLTTLSESFGQNDEQASTKTKTTLAYNEPPPAPAEPVIQEPILEAFLDSGKREYIRRAQPEYPRIYLQTGTQGDVLVEVIVDRQGNIEDQRVLRSDGELFTDAALSALKKFLYKPGEMSGQPVKYKIVERFRFTLNNSR